MRLSYKQEVIEFIIKIIIASIAGVIIIFYNVDSVDNKKKPEDIYDQAIEQYKYHNSQKIVQQMQNTGEILTGRIFFDEGWTTGEKENIEEIIITTISSLDNIIRTNEKITKTIKTIMINKDKGKSRGYSTHDTLTINYGDMIKEEFIQIITHELGHIIDLGVIQGTSKIKDKSFTEFGDQVFNEDDTSLGYYSLSRNSENIRKENNKKTDFCSIYGMSNPFEDFAECLQIYLNHHDYFLQIKKSRPVLEKKYEFMKRLFGEKYLYDVFIPLQLQSDTTRYRDSTRMK